MNSDHLSKMIKKNVRELSVRDVRKVRHVIHAIASRMGLSADEFYSKFDHPDLIRGYKIVMYLLQELTDLSLEQIEMIYTTSTSTEQFSPQTKQPTQQIHHKH